MEREVGGRNDHGALGDGVLGCHWEVLLGQVGDHDDWWAVAEDLLDDGAGPGKLLERVERDGCVDVAVAGVDVLLANLCEELWTISHDLEEPCGGRRSGVLGGEEEREDGHGDFEVAEPANDHGWLLRLVNVLASFDPLAILLRLNHVLDPEVEDAFLLATSGHADLGLRSALGELVEHHVGRLLAVPALGEGQDDGEVDELERSGDQVVVVGDLLDSLLRHVVSDKSPAAHRGDEEAELMHPWDVLALVLHLREVHPALKILVVDFLLAGQILFERLAGEEAIETLAVVDVGLAIEEDPIVGAQELVGGVDDAGLDV